MFKRYTILLAVLALSAAAHAELRDPTLPGRLPGSETADVPDIASPAQLTAIWISDTSRRATINGETVEAGQSLADGSRILKIRPRFVVIRQDGITKKLYLVPSVKKPVK